MRRFCWILLAGFILTSAPTLAQGPGLYELPMQADEEWVAGVASVWNSHTKLHIKIIPVDNWRIVDTQIYVGTDPVPTKRGNAVPGKFPYKRDYDPAAKMHDLVLDLRDDLEMTWGEKSADERTQIIAIHANLIMVDGAGNPVLDEFEDPVVDEAWAFGPDVIGDKVQERCFEHTPYHPRRGQFIDSPVQGLSYFGPTQEGVTGADETELQGGFLFFPDEVISFAIGSVPLGGAVAAKKVSPLDLYPGADTGDPRVVGVARTLQTLDADSGALARDGKIDLLPEVVGCFEGVVGSGAVIDFGNEALVTDILEETVAACTGAGGSELAVVDAISAQANLDAGLNASGIFRKNLSKTEDWGESKQKLDVMPVYFPGLQSNGEPSLCVDVNGDKIYDEAEDTLGVPYEEWRLNGDPNGEECDPRVDGETCVVTLIECRDVAKPLVVTYKEGIDLTGATTDFNVCGEDLPEGVPCRFSNDIYTAVSRDDGTTWKRMNVSRMADLSSFDLETGEPFPGTSSSPYLKVNDNYILVVWESKFCKSGNPRYAINICDEMNVDFDGDGIADSCEICRDTAQGTICEYDYPYDNPYHVTDIWGVRGQQRSVDYDEVDDVAELGIGEIPYSCLWAARGAIVTEKDLVEGAYASLNVEDDPETPDVDETRAVVLGDIIWYKPERLTSGRRDAYIPVAGSARGAGFAIAWQEDPSGLRPGKGKGPGQGWSGAISNHKTDIWYSYISYEDFATVDANFVPGGPGDDPNGEASYDERPGLGRPKPLVPFSLPVRVSDNDMVNTHTLKVEPSSSCVTTPDGTEPICFPEVDTTTGTFVPLNSDEIAIEFCDHPDANPDTCCDPDNHEGDPNCEDLKGLYGNLTGTKRFAYMAKSIDDDGDGVPDYQYYEDRGGTLDLCDTSGTNAYMDVLPGTLAHERWYGFTNVAGSSKLVCVTSDGRLMDGDVSASRPNMQIQPYTKADGTKSAWVLLGYEESKGMGHSLAAEAHDQDTENPVDDIIQSKPEEPGQDKPIKQDIGKNVIYHSFDFREPDLVAPGHIVNLPALCGGLYPNYCGEDYEGTNPTCTCDAGQPVPLYFDYYIDNGDDTGEWMPDETKFLQFRTEIARRTRFIVQSPGKMGVTKTLGAIIYKQGQEGQGRPADVFIRRIVKSGSGNPYKFENFECKSYLDQTYTLPACPNGAGGKPSAVGYNCNVWGEASGDRLCGGLYTDPNGGYPRRDHINLTSTDVDLSVDAGPDDDTPDDPTDDVYGTDKVLLWSQFDYNLGNESYGVEDTTVCDLESCAGMYSNARSHRGFVRGDFLVTAYAYSPNWAAARNGRDRYNFYIRKSFDGGQTWTTNPAGTGTNFCPEWRADPNVEDPDGTGNAPPVFDGFDPECVDWCPPCPDGEVCDCTVTGDHIAAGMFQPAMKVSEFDNNKETSSDPRVGATPPTYPLDGRDATLPILRFVEDEYVDNIFFVAWGAGDNLKSTGGSAVTPEAPPTDVYYTRSEDFGDHFLKIPWEVNGESSNFAGETVWRYQRLAWGDPEQGECQLRATSDGSKVYSIYHQMTPVEGDPDEPLTRWYPWEPEESHDNDLWFRRVIFWPDEVTTPLLP